MGWRFRKRIKIFPGFYINISKSGLGVNIGPKGANVSVGPNGTYVNTGIPGTGLYKRDKVDNSKHSSTEIQQEPQNYRAKEVTTTVNNEEQQYGGSVGSQLNTHHTAVNRGNNHSDISYGDISMPYNPKKDLENYRYPTIDLLKKYDYDDAPYVDMEELQANKNRIVETLRSVGIEISFIKATIGPRVTLYEIMLAPGVNASKLKEQLLDQELHYMR